MVFPKFMSFCVLKFCSVGELSCWGFELEIECQIAYPSVTGKVQNLRKSKTYFGQFWHALSTYCLNQSLLCAGGRAESALLLSFLCKVLRHKDSLPFPREKIDSGVFYGITLAFLPIPKYGSFFFFFLFFFF